jgi:threonine dehydrogenase-like Zn-dependent dehydrogenase
MASSPTTAPSGTMRAAFLAAPGQVEVIDHPMPSPGPGEVLLRVGAASICGSDLSAYRGVHSRIRPPTILGHEFSGTIVEHGPGTGSLAVGTHVAAEPNIACGRCRFCERGAPNVCVDYLVVGEDVSRPGACAEFIKVPEQQCHPLPEGVTLAEGALVQPLAIAHRGVDRAQVAAGETVLVIGAGPIGIAAMRIARIRGARTVVVDPLAYRLKVARRFGADAAVTPEEADRAVFDLTDGYGAEVSIEAAGGNQIATFVQACRLTARQGRVVVIGSFKIDEAPLPILTFKFRELDIRGSQGHPGTFRPVLDLIASGELPARDLITHSLPLDRVADGFALLADRREDVMKVVIEPGG